MKKTILLFLLAIIGLSTANAQLGIGTTNPAESSILDLTVTNKALLLSRVATVNEISTPVNGMIVYDIFNECIRGFEAGAWSDCLNVSPAIAVISSGACVGEPVSFTFNGKEYRPIESAGQCWLDRNLGATQVATQPRSDFSDDSSYIASQSSSFGDLYQWGRGTDGHQIRTSGTTTILATTDVPAHGDFITTNISPSDWRDNNNNNRWNASPQVNNPCPTDYRVPTESELNTERLSWVTANSAGAFASPLNLPVAGFRSRTTGGLLDDGFRGNYWSSSVSGTNALYLSFGSSDASMFTFVRSLALSVRCIKD